MGAFLEGGGGRGCCLFEWFPCCLFIIGVGQLVSQSGIRSRSSVSFRCVFLWTFWTWPILVAFGGCFCGSWP